MADVFISYKSERRAAAEHLARILELNGYTVWFDYGLMSGKDFSRQIERELRAARAVIVLWCSRSVDSEWVSEEAHLAKKQEKIVPCMIERIDLPLGFGLLDTIDLSHWDGSPGSNVLYRLWDEIARLLGRDPVPQVRALREYESNWRRFGAPTLASFTIEPALVELGGRSSATPASVSSASETHQPLPASPPPAATPLPAQPASGHGGAIRAAFFGAIGGITLFGLYTYINRTPNQDATIAIIQKQLDARDQQARDQAAADKAARDKAEAEEKDRQRRALEEDAAKAKAEEDQRRQAEAKAAADKAAADKALADRIAQEVAAQQKPDPALAFRAKLYDRIISAIPALGLNDAQALARQFQEGSEEKALAFAPGTSISWRGVDWGNSERVKEYALEVCELVAAKPCALLAVNGEFEPAQPNGQWKAAPQPRVAYTGSFDLTQIPAMARAKLAEPDVLSYPTARAPKAMAHNSLVGLSVAAGAANQRAAEEAALADCNEKLKALKTVTACLLYASGDQVVLPQRSKSAITPARKEPTPEEQAFLDKIAKDTAAMQQPNPGLAFRAKFYDRIVNVISDQDAQRLTAIAKGYQEAKNNKAIAAAPNTSIFFWSSERSTVAIAQLHALESCQLLTTKACALVASNDVLESPQPNGQWAVRQLPRLAYIGSYNPDMIPAVIPSAATNKAAADYQEATGPKALVLNSHLGLFASTSAASQRAAEEAALDDCKARLKTLATITQCHLYAIGDQVVLPERLTSAKTPPPAPASTNTIATVETLTAAIAKAAPTSSISSRTEFVPVYLREKEQKAIAALPGGSTWWRTSGWETREEAILGSLEGCEGYAGQPCALIAINDRIEPPNDGSGWKATPTPRVGYLGRYNPQQIPRIRPHIRNSGDILKYGEASSFKAMAFHPWGVVFPATGASSQKMAEEQALKRCNDDPARTGKDGPCYLYAIGDHVVLPRRMTGASEATIVEVNEWDGVWKGLWAPGKPVQMTFLGGRPVEFLHEGKATPISAWHLKGGIATLSTSNYTLALTASYPNIVTAEYTGVNGKATATLTRTK